MPLHLAVLLSLVFFLGLALYGHAATDGAERLAAAWGVGIAVLAGCQYLVFLTGVNQETANTGTLSILGLYVGLSLRRLYGESRAWDRDAFALAGLWLLGFLSLLCLQCLLPVYVGAGWYGDWMMHYENALVFRGERPVETRWIGVYPIGSRTPLFNLAAAFVMSIVGDDFWVYQVVATLMNYTVVAGLYLVLRDLGGNRVARLALLLAPLNIWLMHQAWFTWPKLLATYYALLSLHFYLRRLAERSTGRLYGCWIFGLLGFMTHQVVVVYLAALAVHAAMRLWKQRRGVSDQGKRLERREAHPSPPAPLPEYGERGDLEKSEMLSTLSIQVPGRISWPTAAWFLFIAAAIVGPWYGWLAYRFGGIGNTPVTLMDQSTSFHPLRILAYMGHNAATSLVPVQLVQLVGSDASWLDWYNAVTDFYFSLLPGALTVSLSLFLVVAGVFRLRSANPRRERGEECCIGYLPTPHPSPPPPQGGREPEAACGGAVSLFLVVGIVGGLALHPALAQHGVAHSALFPAVTLILGLAWLALARAPRPWRQLVALGIVLEGLIMLWSHVWLAQTPGQLDPLGVNPYEKHRFAAVLLFDLLGSWRWAAAVTAAGLQILFVALLFRQLGVEADASPAAPPEL